MSDLLQQAMIDAAALREAAIKNAENALIEKYSQEFNQTVQKLLEQEATATADPATAVPTPPAADPMAADTTDVESAAAPAADTADTDLSAGAVDPMADNASALTQDADDAFSKVPGSFSGDDNEMITINFDQIRATLNEMMGIKEEEAEGMEEMYDDSLKQDVASDALHSEPSDEVIKIKYSLGAGEEAEEEIELDEEELEEDAAAEQQTAKGYKELAGAAEKRAAEANRNEPSKDTMTPTASKMEEDIELTEEELQELAEELRVDLKVGNLSDGYMGSTETQKREQRNVELAAARDQKAAEQREEEVEKMKDLMQENINLKKINNQALNTLQTLKEQLEKLSLSNAKLLYTNKALGNISLNERQKTTIVESISKADSVLAAKTIYESVQNAVENVSKEKEAPQSLRETLNRAATPFVVKKSKVNNIDDIMAQRMKALAGIKK